MAGALGGLCIASVVGHVLQWTGSDRVPFLIAGSAYLLALTIVHALVPKMEPAIMRQELQT
jgi:ACS family hexuronate transporter-like MFS transporter